MKLWGCNTYPCPESRPSGAETTITNLRSFLNRTKQEKRRNNKKSAAFFRSAFRSRERHRLLFLFRSITLRVTVRNPRIRSSFPHFVLESAVLLRQQLTEDFLDGRLLVSTKYESSFTCKYSLIILILVLLYILTPPPPPRAPIFFYNRVLMFAFNF